MDEENVIEDDAELKLDKVEDDMLGVSIRLPLAGVGPKHYWCIFGIC